MELNEFRKKMENEGKTEGYDWFVTPIGVMYSTPYMRELLDQKS